MPKKRKEFLYIRRFDAVFSAVSGASQSSFTKLLYVTVRLRPSQTAHCMLTVLYITSVSTLNTQTLLRVSADDGLV